MRFLFAIVLLYLATSTAEPPPTLTQILRGTQVENVKVTTSLGVLRVLGLLVVKVLLAPLLPFLMRQLTLPYRMSRAVLTLPYRIVRFVTNIPMMIVRLPINILLLPVTLLTLVARILKRIIRPISRILCFIFYSVGFLMGTPVKVFGVRYVY